MAAVTRRQASCIRGGSTLRKRNNQQTGERHERFGLPRASFRPEHGAFRSAPAGTATSAPCLRVPRCLHERYAAADVLATGVQRAASQQGAAYCSMAVGAGAAAATCDLSCHRGSAMLARPARPARVPPFDARKMEIFPGPWNASPLATGRRTGAVARRFLDHGHSAPHAKHPERRLRCLRGDCTPGPVWEQQIKVSVARVQPCSLPRARNQPLAPVAARDAFWRARLRGQ